MPYKNKEKQKEYMKNYKKTKKGKLANKKYRYSEKGKIKDRKAHKKYYNSKKGKISQRKNNTKHRKKYPEKTKARYPLNNAIRDGRLTRDICAICGKENAQIHHENYDYPFHIIWLCPKHHNMATNNQRVREKVKGGVKI